MMTERHVLLHGHIFKNAGSTVDWSLARSFDGAFVDHRDDQAMRSEGAAYLQRYLEEHASVRALSSHHLCYPLPELIGIQLHALFMIRHPLDRVLSVYHFERRQLAKTPGAINAKRWGLKKYIAWRLTPTAGATIRNFQTRYLCGKFSQPRRPVVRNDWCLAVQRMAEASIGVVEEFDRSMVVLEHALQPRFPGIDLSYVPQNVGRRPREHDAAAELQHELGAELFHALLAENGFDLMLYEATIGLLRTRLNAIPDAESRLIDFRQRCADLRDA